MTKHKLKKSVKRIGDFQFVMCIIFAVWFLVTLTLCTVYPENAVLYRMLGTSLGSMVASLLVSIPSWVIISNVYEDIDNVDSNKVDEDHFEPGGLYQ